MDAVFFLSIDGGDCYDLIKADTAGVELSRPFPCESRIEPVELIDYL
jgi:hypothetical protein